MMFEYAEAMLLANNAYRPNPNNYEYVIEWVQDGIEHSVPANYIDAGHASIVFLGKDKHVYIGTRKDAVDQSKDLLARFNKKYGPTPHIPEIELIEETVMPFPVYDNSKENIWTERENEDLVGQRKNNEPIGVENVPVKLYRSKFYKVPVNSAGWTYSNFVEDFYRDAFYRVTRKSVKHFNDLIGQGIAEEEAEAEREKFLAKNLAKELGKWRSWLNKDPRPTKTQKRKLESIFASFNKLQKFIYKNYDSENLAVRFEFQPFNLANDSRKNLILLDIFFTRRFI